MANPLKGIAPSFALAAALVASLDGRQVDVLAAKADLTQHVVPPLPQPIACVEAPTGELAVLDRRTHAAFLIDKNRTVSRRFLDLEQPASAPSEPGALSIGPTGLIAVADAPTGVDRVQYFTADGKVVGGFFLPDKVPRPANGPGRPIPGPLVMDMPGTMQLGGQAFEITLPGRGSLISEIDMHGATIRQIGLPRRTGQESDPDLHLTLNFGFPAIDPTGGVYYVFRTGVPMFRKYDKNGTLLFERHIEGPELDRRIQSLPDVWPPRNPAEHTAPYVEPEVLAAAVDPDGHLWISLATSYTYVYDARGDKIRTVQFEAIGTMTPTSFFFASRNRLLASPGCVEFAIK